ncbi:MAG: FMN-binding glutamate synthase family protein [Propionibacteriales bacterium]|nr:FMN-binding glutamate synthase family protein [Propionibacteriales bacterium]
MKKWQKAVVATPGGGLAGGAAFDLWQKNHPLRGRFPVIGHARYLLEALGPELRQYIVTDNDEERPFSRDQRRWVYASAKGQDNHFGFGTDNDLEVAPGYAIIKHRTFADTVPDTRDSAGTDAVVPSAKVLGGPRGRAKAFRPNSLVNVSAMSFGSLSSPAIKALNAGAKLAGCLHNTGEGGLSEHHKQGGDLTYQIGTGYFGCRDADGRFSLDRLIERIEGSPVRSIEIKLSQGAKPGLGGLLPAAKVSREIAEIRGIPLGQDCASPSRHSAFGDVDSMLDFVERVAQATGLPVGIKSAIGDLTFWQELAGAMESGERGVDFVTIDGGEGGTGAAPRVFADSVAQPFRIGFRQVYGLFAEAGIVDRLTFIGSGRLGLPDQAAVAFALGVDMINIAREAMLAIGCIQAQKCHTDHCPTGVATQNAWLTRGLDPTLKSVRLGNYIQTLRHEMLKLSEAIGVAHPGLITVDDIDLLTGDGGVATLRDVVGYRDGWGQPGADDRQAIVALMTGAKSGENAS